MNSFKERIKAMVKTREKKEEMNEKRYDYRDIKVVEDTKDRNIFICEVESLGYDYSEFRRRIGANDIESGEQVAEYVLQGLPAGRVCFGGYTDNSCNNGKVVYSFIDVWYKIYGKHIKSDKEFTKSELLAVSPEIKEKFKDTRYKYIYSIKSKGKDIKDLTQYLSRKNSEEKMFEIIDGKYILTDFYIMKSNIPEFEIKEIKSMDSSRIYSTANFTKEACIQIIDDYVRSIESDPR